MVRCLREEIGGHFIIIVAAWAIIIVVTAAHIIGVAVVGRGGYES